MFMWLQEPTEKRVCAKPQHTHQMKSDTLDGAKEKKRFQSNLTTYIVFTSHPGKRRAKQKGFQTPVILGNHDNHGMSFVNLQSKTFTSIFFGFRMKKRRYVSFSNAFF